MATRLYVRGATGVPTGVTVAADASWEASVSTPTRLASLTPLGEAIGNPSGVGSGADPNDLLMRQIVTEPIAAQTVTGTVKGQFGTTESNAAVNARTQIVARVVSGDGGTVRGTLIASAASALSSEFVATNTNRKVPLAADSPVTVSDVAAEAGDRIVFEVGVRIHSTDTTNTASIRFSDVNSAGDLPEDETTTTTNTMAGWIEMSHDVAWYYPLDPMGISGMFGT